MTNSQQPFDVFRAIREHFEAASPLTGAAMSHDTFLQESYISEDLEVAKLESAIERLSDPWELIEAMGDDITDFLGRMIVVIDSPVYPFESVDQRNARIVAVLRGMVDGRVDFHARKACE